MNEITLGVQSESAAGGLISRMHPRVNELFEEHMSRDYCPEVDAIMLVLRLGTAREEFGPDGLQRRRLMKKQRYITIDLVMNEESYVNESEEANRDRLLDLLKQALMQCVEKLQADKCRVDAGRLFGDFAKFERDFRSRWRKPLVPPM